MTNTESRFDRTRLLVGDGVMDRLGTARVIIFGVGGVGSWCAESLARSGVADITIVDCDFVDQTNINRQMPALDGTVGQVKTDVVRDRILAINPVAKVTAIREYYTESTADRFDFDGYDYVIDAIDSLKDKALLLLCASRSRATLFSSMGAALKMDPTRISVAEFWKVSGCPLGAALRQKFRRSGEFPAKKFLCVYSPELFRNRGESSHTYQPEKSGDDVESVDLTARKAVINGTVAHTTAVFGFTLAGLVVQDMVRREDVSPL
ncbi:MAG: tRNA threonylcarbamoyladenosine dehydratase [Muribaculaceae bacterium]|nr:tRNA threonylcarbamoyladenosine dehydratase [Muribaculaceae bacterium]